MDALSGILHSVRLEGAVFYNAEFRVARVSGEVGYESEQAFNRAFKREFGDPPARFRVRARTRFSHS